MAEKEKFMIKQGVKINFTQIAKDKLPEEGFNFIILIHKTKIY